MSLPVLVAAKRLAQNSGWSLSNLELQKMLYLAHMFHLGRSNEPLVSGWFEAWDYGPVHPKLYHYVKVFGSDPVENIFHQYPEPPPGVERDILDEAWSGLSGARPGQLVAATHRKGGAWETHYVPGERHIVIPNEDIRREYLSLEEATDGQSAQESAAG